MSLDYSLKTTSDKVNATNIINFAKSIYISPTGNGDGTIDNPTNLNTALTNICNGGTIYFKSGEYDLSSQISTQSKTINFVGLENVCINLNQINLNKINYKPYYLR